MTRLRGFSGAQFDREYINAMVSGHRDAVRLFEGETGTGSGNSASSAANNSGGSNQPNSTNPPGQRGTSSNNPQGTPGIGGSAPATSGLSNSTVKILARDMLPTIKQHLQHAEAIQKTLN